ncbi:hypothetical protein Agub_g5721 [Astrephomene gubernaculifera]|uniref:Uncharacterized protein n=1 Tax=Astrephomene gubernaculifera TaxID=47775 RepID=A0AAD3DM84_9CHLO|nr:hypothetical protein Agub_g5721 [Astrephomene gubernaculifera]
MLSAALRGTPPVTIGSQSTSLQPRLPPVLQQPQPPSRTVLSSSVSSLEEPLFESPRAPTVGAPIATVSAAQADADADAFDTGDELEGDVFGAADDLDDGPSARSSQTHPSHHLFLSTPGAPGPLASSVTASTPVTLLSAGPSGEFTIGQAAMGAKGSIGDLQAELEHLTSCGGGRVSRPIGIPRAAPFMSSTYHPAAGAFMQGFVPPHEIAAASVRDSDPMIMHSHRHKSTAERLRTAVFEQTGFMSVTTAAAFLQTSQMAQPSRRS